MILIFCLLVLISVVSSDDSSKENFKTVGAYNFNHPPNFDYNPIPVEIVYDDDPYEGKSIDEVVSTTEYFEEITEEPEKLVQNSNTAKFKPKEEVLPKGRSLSGVTSQTVAETYPVQVEVATTEQTIRRPLKGTIGRRRQQTKEPVKTTLTPYTKSTTTTTTTTTTTVKYIPSQQSERFSLLPVQETRSNNNKNTRERKPVVPIIESENQIYDKGNFHYSYEGGDGTKSFHQGELKKFDDDTAGEAVSGSISYRDKDGNDFSLTYTADENGYRPVGAHLPTPPPIPPAIARALKHLATKPVDTATEIYY